jgi:hypothetical protein
VSWLIILPANFLIDLLVYYFSLRHLQIENRKEFLFPTVWKIWGFGFLSDLLGCLLLLGIYLLSSLTPSLDAMNQGLVWNPFMNVFSFLLTAGSVLAAGYLIYFFNHKYSFNKIGMNEMQKHKTSIYLAVFTAPYVLLIPTMLFYAK